MQVLAKAITHGLAETGRSDNANVAVITVPKSGVMEAYRTGEDEAAIKEVTQKSDEAGEDYITAVSNDTAAEAITKATAKAVITAPTKAAEMVTEALKIALTKSTTFPRPVRRC